MFDVILGILLIVVGIMSLLLGSSFEHLLHQYPYSSPSDTRMIFVIVYSVAIFVIIYGFKRLVDSVLKAWTRTTVEKKFLDP